MKKLFIQCAKQLRFALALLTFILFSVSMYSQCACISKKKFCREGSFMTTEDIGDGCLGIVLNASASSSDSVFAAIVTDTDTKIHTTTYPQRLCDLFQYSAPGRWDVSKVDSSAVGYTYDVSYEGLTDVRFVGFGDSVLDGPKFTMIPCSDEETFCSEGIFRPGREIGNDCMDVILTADGCVGGCPGAPFSSVTTVEDTFNFTGSYPIRLCDLLNNAVAGNWTIERLALSEITYKITYQGMSDVRFIRLGDNVLDGPKIDMEDCSN